MNRSACAHVLQDSHFSIDQRRHALLRVLNSIILETIPSLSSEAQVNRSVQDDELEVAEEDDEEESESDDDEVSWGECLLSANEQLLLDIVDLAECILQLLASIRPLLKGPAIDTIMKFLRISAIAQCITMHVTNNAFIGGPMEWMALSNWCRIRLMPEQCFESLLRLASKELQSMLDLSPPSWDMALGISIRMRTENIVCVLNYIVSYPESKSEWTTRISHHCYDHLVHMTARLEAGILADKAAEQERQEILDDEEEEDEDMEEDEVFGKVPSGDKTTSNMPTTKSNTRSKANDSTNSRGYVGTLNGEGADENVVQNAANHRARLMEQRWQSEILLPSTRTPWCSIALSSITHVLSSCIQGRKFGQSNPLGAAGLANTQVTASGAPARDRDLSEYFSMLHSPCWQRQTLALGVIKAALVVGAKCGGLDASSGLRGDEGDESNDAKKGNARIPEKGASARRNTNAASGKVGLSGKVVGGIGSSPAASAFTGPKVPSTRARGTARASKSGVMEEMCKNGALRPLCWLLLNKTESVRTCAGAILRLLLDRAMASDDAGNAKISTGSSRGGSGSVEFWASLIEQGIIPLLQSILSGNTLTVLGPIGGGANVGTRSSSTPVSSVPLQLFPESSIRSIASNVLAALADRLESSTLLRTRLANALLFSGNPTLRINIFIAMAFLIGVSNSVGNSLLCLSTQVGQNGIASGVSGGRGSSISDGASMGNVAVDQSGEFSVFRTLLGDLGNDPSELKHFIAVLAHILRMSLVLWENGYLGPTLEEVSSPAGNGQRGPATKSLADRLAGGATVLVTGENGMLMKMVCPTAAAVMRRGLQLAKLLSKLEADEATGAPSATLPGSYSTWQEVFSHAVDDHLFETSIERMSSDAVIDAYYLARRYSLGILLEKYGQTLTKRLTADTVVVTLEAALGRGKDSFMYNNLSTYMHSQQLPPAPSGSMISPLAPGPSPSGKVATTDRLNPNNIHLKLLASCFSYLERHADNVFLKRYPQRSEELVTLIHHALEYIFSE